LFPAKAWLQERAALSDKLRQQAAAGDSAVKGDSFIQPTVPL
jgi:hypothetical protein